MCQASSYCKGIDVQICMSTASDTSLWLLSRSECQMPSRSAILFHPFPGHVQQQNNRESALSFNNKLFRDGKVSIKNLTHLSLAFLKCKVRGVKLLWRTSTRMQFTFLFILGIKTVCHRTWCTLRCSISSLHGCVCACVVNRERAPLSRVYKEVSCTCSCIFVRPCVSVHIRMVNAKC